jgi:cell division protein FtsB
MMILALFLTIVILAIAVYLRIRTFQAPETAPAVYDTPQQEEAEKKTVEELKKSAGESTEEPSAEKTEAAKKP